MQHAQKIFGYIRKIPHATVQFQMDLPDYLQLSTPHYDWEQLVYGDLRELRPSDAPKPLGNPIVTSSYKDVNLMHDLLTGRSVTGILHFVNKTLIDWYAKKQATVKTATYGSKFVSARTCVEQIIDLRNTLHYLGVPISDHSYMFGDNKSVINSSVMPHLKLNKRHMMLSLHKVRECIASGMVKFYHITGYINPADILSKHWSHATIWPILQSVLFYPGDTCVLLQK